MSRRTHVPKARDPSRGRVFLAVGDATSKASSKAIARAKEKAAARGLLVVRLEASRAHFRGSPSRKRLVLPADEAHDAYRRLHTCRALVLAFGEIYVPRNPRSFPPRAADAIKLATFVAHKATYCRTSIPADIDDAFERYDIWLGEKGCSGVNDPRTLPLHVFDTTADWSRLGEPHSNQQFAERYGPASARCDDSGKRWSRGVPHGRDGLRVAGCDLGAGMHWDVSTSKAHATIMNGREIWQLRKGAGYLNVGPDAHFRKAPSKSTARLVWR